jgi:hypothetical protein
MTTKSETGYINLLANFDALISRAKAFNETYNPSNKIIMVPSMIELSTLARQAVEEVNSAYTVFNKAISERVSAFEPMGKISSRMLSSLKACGTNDQIVNTARSFVRKLQGRRATPAKSDEEKKQAEAAGVEIKENSVSQMSFDSRLGNFNRLICLLKGIPEYTPNEIELKIESLNTMYNDLVARNESVRTAAANLGNARIHRDAILYDPEKGLTVVASNSKDYIRSVFGQNSPEFRQISSLVFHKN